MAFTDLIKPGDKIDIRLLQQVENEERTGDTVKVYKSQVLDINKRGNLEISMPTEGTKLILLPLDVRLEFVFYSGGFLYKSIGQIVERFKRDNIYTLEVELKTRLEKFQRREFYRYECSIDFKFFELTEEQADLATVEEIFAQLRDEHFNDKIRTGTIVDISGGGIRFNSDTELKSGDHILAVAHLANERMNQEFHIVGSVISCEKKEQVTEKKYVSRVSALMRRVICDIINSDDTFQVTDVCRDGLEAYEKLKVNRYDGVILDVNMPRMGGLELLERLQKERIKTNVIMVSTMTTRDADVTILAMERGAVDFVTKPTNIIEGMRSGKKS